ncbi:Uncharacterised protein [Mycobacterium tuberculosis]|nr:Uncharacterised protein [Mycobacterium tuberculosis]
MNILVFLESADTGVLAAAGGGDAGAPVPRLPVPAGRPAGLIAGRTP